MNVTKALAVAALSACWLSGAAAQELVPEKIQVLAQPGGAAIMIGQPDGAGGVAYSFAAPGGMMPGGGSMGLLYDDNVRTDLAVTQEQWNQLQEAQQRIQRQMRDELISLRDVPPAERPVRLADIRRKMEESQKELESILQPKQQKRLRQIGIQSRLSRGGTASTLLSDEIAAELGITDAQKEQIRQGAEEIERELREKMEKLREEARERILAMLTPAQRARLKEMIGERVTFSSTAPFGGLRIAGPGGGLLQPGAPSAPSPRPIERLPGGD
jgi:hypothetical protein